MVDAAARAWMDPNATAIEAMRTECDTELARGKSAHAHRDQRNVEDKKSSGAKAGK